MHRAGLRLDTDCQCSGNRRRSRCGQRQRGTRHRQRGNIQRALRCARRRGGRPERGAEIGAGCGQGIRRHPQKLYGAARRDPFAGTAARIVFGDDAARPRSPARDAVAGSIRRRRRCAGRASTRRTRACHCRRRGLPRCDCWPAARSQKPRRRSWRSRRARSRRSSKNCMASRRRRDRCWPSRPRISATSAFQIPQRPARWAMPRPTIARPRCTTSPRARFTCPTAPSWKRIRVSAKSSTIRATPMSGCAASRRRMSTISSRARRCFMACRRCA